MSRMAQHHQEIVFGKGRCSVPMWMCGMPAGFCDRPAFGRQSRPTPDPTAPWRYVPPNMHRTYAPGLACDHHQGPTLAQHIKGKTVLRFSEPPGPDSQFIEAERDGASVSVGIWIADGTDWLLVLSQPPATPTEGSE